TDRIFDRVDRRTGAARGAVDPADRGQQARAADLATDHLGARVLAVCGVGRRVVDVGDNGRSRIVDRHLQEVTEAPVAAGHATQAVGADLPELDRVLAHVRDLIARRRTVRVQALAELHRPFGVGEV